jgi:hypothetical protein
MTLEEAIRKAFDDWKYQALIQDAEVDTKVFNFELRFPMRVDFDLAYKIYSEVTNVK